MHEADGHGALADRAGDALHRVVAHVAGGEEAGQARLEQERLRDPGSSRATASTCGTGEDEAALVAGDDAVEPGGVAAAAR